MAQQAGGNGWSQAANSWDGWWDAAWDVNQWWSPGNWRWREQDARGAGGWEEEPRQPEATGHQGNAAWAQGTPQPTQQPLPRPMPQAAVAVPPAAAAAGPPAVPPAVAAAEPPHGPQQRPPQAQQPTADWLAPKQPAPTPPPAPAPAATRQPAVAGAPPAAAEAPPAAADGPTVFDLEFLLNREVTAHWKCHNAALKYFRFAHEGNIGEDEEVVFNNARPERVAKILHEAVGPGCGFDIEITDWWWQDMIAQLDAWSMAFVVNGSDGRSGGVLGCSFLSPATLLRPQTEFTTAGSAEVACFRFRC